MELIHFHGGKSDTIKMSYPEPRLGAIVEREGEQYELTEEVWAGEGQSRRLDCIEAHLVRA